VGNSYCIELGALDDFDLAVARFDREGVLTYQNPAAARLFGVSMESHVDITMLFPDMHERQRVLDQIKTRIEGKSSVYKTVFHRPDEPGSPGIPIGVFAFPDSDADGHVLGSVTLVRDLREEIAREQIHAVIESSTDNRTMLDGLATALRNLIEFKDMRVVTMSADRAHLRRLHTTNPEDIDQYRLRWWPMPPFILATLPDSVAELLDVPTLLADSRYQELLERDEGTRRYLHSGVQQIVRLPVWDENRVVAFFHLDTCERGRFTEDTLRLLERLPVAQAVLGAMHREAREQDKQVLELIGDIGAVSMHVQRAAKVLVNRLVQDFGWDHVSIFQSDALNSRLRLVIQANLPGHPALPENCEIATNEPGNKRSAILQALTRRQHINKRETRAHGPFAGMPGFEEAGSELAIPIQGRRVRWVLNIESSFTNAFATEEIDLLKILTNEARSVLHRSALFELQEAVLHSINDAVIETDADGSIRWANRAARELLGIKNETASRTSIVALIEKSDMHDTLTKTPHFYHHEVTMRAADGALIPVLLSASTLPDHLSGRVYVASDFRFQKEVQRMTELKEVFRQAAMEGRVPLALAAVWLSEFGQAQPALQEAIDKVAAQLGRADLPLERLLRLFTSDSEPLGKQCADLHLALQTTMAELPRNLAEAIALTEDGDHVQVGVSFDNLQFCIESMISFGLRTRPQSKKLTVVSERCDGRALFRVCGDWVPDMSSSREPGPSEQWRRKSLSDLTLGDTVISRIIEKADGQFACELDANLSLQFALPVISG
jgi:PAS domain S-box-containing protein